MHLRLGSPIVKTLTVALSCVLFVGSILDAVSNAKVVTPGMTYTLTAILVAGAFLVHLVLRKHPLTVTKDDGHSEHISGLNVKALAALSGIIILLWLPRFVDADPTPPPSGQAPPTSEMGSVSLDVWLSADDKSIEESFGPEVDEKEMVSYRAANREGGVVIEPQLPYLELVSGGGPIKPIMRQGSFFGLTFPALDFKLANNRKETVFATRMVLMVESSRLDPSPLLLFVDDPAKLCKLRLINEGWAEVRDVDLAFRLHRRRETPDFSAPFPYGRNDLTLGESAEIDLAPELGQNGVDAGALIRLYAQYQEAGSKLSPLERGEVLAAQGPYAPSEPFGVLDEDESFGVYAAGVLSFTGTDREGKTGRKEVRFVADVPIVIPQLGDAFKETGAYDAMLQVDGANYEVTVPISHSLKSGEVDRFFVRVGAKGSSVHRLRAKLVLNDGKEVISGPVKVSLLVPRTNAAELANKPSRSTPSGTSNSSGQSR